MNVTFRVVGDAVYLYLDGEMDECSVSALRRETDRVIEAHSTARRAVFNLSGVRFMDSTGIGFLIGRYKKLQRYGVEMYLENPNLTADKVLSVSGVYTLIPKI